MNLTLLSMVDIYIFILKMIHPSSFIDVMTICVTTYITDIQHTYTLFVIECSDPWSDHPRSIILFVESWYSFLRIPTCYLHHHNAIFVSQTVVYTYSNIISMIIILCRPSWSSIASSSSSSSSLTSSIVVIIVVIIDAN